MTYLILDLDETVMQAHGSRTFVNSRHLSPKRFIWRQSITPCDIGNYKFSNIIEVELVILNPDKLSQLISIAINHHDGIIILTSGLWSSAILEPISEQLELASHIKKKFIESPFFSPVIEEQYWKGARSVRDIRQVLTKNDRLNQIINHPNHIATLGRRYFVLLDNDQRHVDSFKDNPRATAIQATTHNDDDSFYFLTLRELRLMRQREEQEVLLETKKQESTPKSSHLRGSLFADQAHVAKSEGRAEVETSASCLAREPREEPSRFIKLGQCSRLFRRLAQKQETQTEGHSTHICCKPWRTEGAGE